jgi:hypothetical protein
MTATSTASPSKWLLTDIPTATVMPNVITRREVVKGSDARKRGVKSSPFYFAIKWRPVLGRLMRNSIALE